MLNCTRVMSHRISIITLSVLGKRLACSKNACPVWIGTVWEVRSGIGNVNHSQIVMWNAIRVCTTSSRIKGVTSVYKQIWKQCFGLRGCVHSWSVQCGHYLELNEQCVVREQHCDKIQTWQNGLSGSKQAWWSAIITESRCLEYNATGRGLMIFSADRSACVMDHTGTVT